MQLLRLAGNSWLQCSIMELAPLGVEKDLVWIFKSLFGKLFFFYYVTDEVWLNG